VTILNNFQSVLAFVHVGYIQKSGCITSRRILPLHDLTTNRAFKHGCRNVLVPEHTPGAIVASSFN
jgi:hypothetical protein